MKYVALVCMVAFVLSLSGCKRPKEQEKRNYFSPMIEVPFDESMGNT